MKYPRFSAHSVIGGTFDLRAAELGFFFGNLEIVKNNFGLVIIDHWHLSASGSDRGSQNQPKCWKMTDALLANGGQK